MIQYLHIQVNTTSSLLTKSVFNKYVQLLFHVDSSVIFRYLHPINYFLFNGVDDKE